MQDPNDSPDFHSGSFGFVTLVGQHADGIWFVKRFFGHRMTKPQRQHQTDNSIVPSLCGLSIFTLETYPGDNAARPARLFSRVASYGRPGPVWRGLERNKSSYKEVYQVFLTKRSRLVQIVQIA